jgi:glycosyltransferase involved in cell wall biosynthesis
MRSALIIPARNEAAALPGLLAELRDAAASPAMTGWTLAPIVVVDNGSTDATAEIAGAHGATVVNEPRRGYGAACLTGLAALRRAPPDVAAFLDADGSDDPADLAAVLAPLAAGNAELVVGSRVLGAPEPGALTPVQRLGNALAARLLGVLYGVRVTDLGPLRAMRWAALERLRMRDRDYGWTVEMQARALRARLAYREVAVRYRRRRGGRSKVAGTLRGVVGAGVKIPATIARVAIGA